MAAAPNNRNKEAMFKQCVSFPHCISEISKKQVDNAKYIDFVINMYNFKKYSKNYLPKFYDNTIEIS